MNKKIVIVTAIIFCITISGIAVGVFMQTNGGSKHSTIVSFSYTDNILTIINQGNYSIGSFTYNITYNDYSDVFKTTQPYSVTGSCNGLDKGQQTTNQVVADGGEGSETHRNYVYFFQVYGNQLSINGGTLQKGATYNLQNNSEYGWFVEAIV